MARIRTIKPELWTDPEFTECSLSARLLFVALLNFATDYGVLPDKPRQLKLQCLPADSCEIEPLIAELIDGDFLVRRAAPNGENVLVIRTFVKNQKINRPTQGRWGDPAEWDKIHGVLTEGAANTHGGPPPGREGKGRDSSEGKGNRQSSSRVLTETRPKGGDDDDLYESVLDLVVEAKIAGKRMDNPKAYRHATRLNTHLEDESLIRDELARGTDVDRVALLVLGYGTEAAKERETIPWCTEDCAECDGDGWIWSPQGLSPCPARR